MNIERHTIIIDGREITYYQAGHGEPLVVVHGGGGDARTWGKNIRELARKYTVYAPDLPGYGGSEPLDGSYFIPELSDFIGRFTAGLGLEKFYLMGHSLGGGVALNYTLASPHRIKKLVLVSSLCLGREIALWVRIFSLPALVKSIGMVFVGIIRGLNWLARNINPAAFVMPLSPASVAVGSNITTLKQQTLVLEDRLRELNVPTLVVWGARDPVVPVEHAYRAASNIPDCRVKVFGNSGHNVHRKELEEFSSLVSGFLG